MKVFANLLGVALVYVVLAGGSLLAEESSYYEFEEAIGMEELASREMGSGAENSEGAKEKPYVVMVSLDGFRHDYVEKHGAESLLQMKESGSYVERLLPSFPSKTFPNHYTLVTGLFPGNHGLVGNKFFSREKNAIYALSIRGAVRDGSWYGGTPLWSLAAKHGMCSAAFFWPGSEAKIDWEIPSYFFQYNKRISYRLRVDWVQHWLELPDETRPHLILLYFSLTDSIGHSFGPESEETGRAVLYVDKQIGRLRAVISASELPINLIVTADHGMTMVTENTNIRDFVDLGESRFVGGPMAMIYTESEAETERIYEALVDKPGFDCYLRDGVPSYLSLQNEDRLGDIVLIAPSPNHLNYWEGAKPMPYGARATHGYDPYREKDMGAIFIAEGPGVAKGVRLDPLENVHVYPFVCALLGLEYEHETDGRSSMMAPMLYHIRKE